MEQTAVEWLIQEHFGGIENCTPYFRKHIKQAIAMEKEQIKDALQEFLDITLPDEVYEKYYNETFKSE